MKRDTSWTEHALRLATIAYVLFMLWTLMGKPSVQTRLDDAARRALRRVAQRADAAASRLGDRMIDRNTTS